MTRREGEGRGVVCSLVPSTHHNLTNCSLFLFLVFCHSTKDQIGAWCSLEFQRGGRGEFPECFFLYKLKKKGGGDDLNLQN